MKLPRIITALFIAILCYTEAFAAKNVLYDDTHGQTAENADWIITGAYSDMADMLEENGFRLTNLSEVSQTKKFTKTILDQYDAIILAEPNDPYSDEECKFFQEYVKNGGGIFIIGDHGNADRNKNGWDAVRAFNEFCPTFGFKFKGDIIYEAPIAGTANTKHPAMFGFRGVGVWAGSSFDILDEKLATGLINSRKSKAPYMVASEYGNGRVFAIGDSSPFDDGVGSGEAKKLHDSYDSFMYSHPQIAYNAMMWVTGQNPDKRIPSRKVAFYNEAKANDKAINILIDAAHGNASSDKMKTFERHMKDNGLKVFYTQNLISKKTLQNFGTFIIPDTSFKYFENESEAISEWVNNGGNLIMGCSWDSSSLRGTKTLNSILSKIGSETRFNDDQIHDPTNKTNKPWGVIAHEFKGGHELVEGVQSVICWGSCSLVNKKGEALKENRNIEIIIKGDEDTFNKDGDKKVPAYIYEPGSGIPIMAIEKANKGRLILIGCCNFTDYQYPDSDINMAQPGPPPFKHDTAKFYDNLMLMLAGKKTN